MNGFTKSKESTPTFSQKNYKHNPEDCQIPRVFRCTQKGNISLICRRRADEMPTGDVCGNGKARLAKTGEGASFVPEVGQIFA